jgi:hypothetical protein
MWRQTLTDDLERFAPRAGEAVSFGVTLPGT